MLAKKLACYQPAGRKTRPGKGLTTGWLVWLLAGLQCGRFGVCVPAGLILSVLIIDEMMLPLSLHLEMVSSYVFTDIDDEVEAEVPSAFTLIL